MASQATPPGPPRGPPMAILHAANWPATHGPGPRDCGCVACDCVWLWLCVRERRGRCPSDGILKSVEMRASGWTPLSYRRCEPPRAASTMMLHSTAWMKSGHRIRATGGTVWKQRLLDIQDGDASTVLPKVKVHLQQSDGSMEAAS